MILKKFCGKCKKTIDKWFLEYYNYTHNLNITKNNDCDEVGRNDMQHRELSVGARQYAKAFQDLSLLSRRTERHRQVDSFRNAA